MKEEIEVKFLHVDHNQIRKKLEALGARCVQPMRLMRRTLIDYPDGRFQKNPVLQLLRVRDEGDKVTITYKYRGKNRYSEETETTAGSYETMISLLESIGLKAYSVQESKREAWQYKNTEVVLDEWPWLDPYIEIEGESEADIQHVAAELGFDWSEAKLGNVDTAYKSQYPGMKDGDSIGFIPVIKFGQPLPEYLEAKK